MIIINADDFGLSEPVTKAIVICLEEGLISSTTIMPTMPAFEFACEQAHEKGLLENIGLHFNLTQGEPLTEEIKRLPKFCNADGRFQYKRLSNVFFSAEEKLAVRKELSAQVLRCRDAGLPLTHLDSHHHVHTELPLFRILASTLCDLEVKLVRRTRNVGATTFKKRIYRTLYSQFLSVCGFSSTDYFGNVEEFHSAESKLSQSSFEIMVHPGLDDQGGLIDTTTNENLRELLEAIVSKQKPVAFLSLSH